MKRVVIYGMGHDYRENYDLIRSMEQRGEIEILCVTDKKVEQECEIDGLRIVPPAVLPSVPFDYIFVVSKAFFSEIVDELVNERGIERSRILSFFIIMMPGMTLDLYWELYSKRWSILCNNCFGGLLSHQFGIEHRSPLKNLYIYERDLIRFAENVTHYLAQEPVFDHWQEAQTCYDESRYPVLRLDDILLFCNHNTDADVARAKFMRGAAKVDPDALMLIMVTSHAKIEREFQEHNFGCPKLCISSVKDHMPKTLYVPADDYLDLLAKANAIIPDPAYLEVLVGLLLGKEEFIY